MRRSAAAAAILVSVVACTETVTLDTLPPTTSSTTTTSTSTTSTTTTTVSLAEAAGVVTDPDGRPIAGVEVGFGHALGATDTDGRFHLITVESGEVALRKPGWLSVELAAESGISEIVMQPMVVRGLRVGAGAARSDDHFQRLLALAEDSAVNTLVFDTKQEGGTVVYDTRVQIAHDIGAVNVHYDPVVRLAQANEAGLYTITRIVVFEDRFWTAANTGERLIGRWVDPAAPGARAYNLDLAAEACALGFDEIQFDYIRYPSGSTGAASGQRQLSQDQRVGFIAGFLEEARQVLQPMGCAVSADIYGIVVSTQNDQGIGQRPEELSRHLDAISPMVYPSHYSDGWLGLPDPNDHPYRVVANALDSALPRLEGGVLRPWLQAFWWTDAQIRDSIQAAEDRGVGWILWNSGSEFRRAALPGADEVANP